MKTFKKVLCVMLSILMAMSCLTCVAFAADGEKFTSTLRKAHSAMSNTQNAKVTLDMVDEALKGADICETVDLKVVKLTIDLRNVNALCGTIDDLKDIMENPVVWVTAKVALGDIGDVDIGDWSQNRKRGSQDITILKKLIYLASDNRGLVKKICNGTLDLGVASSFVNVSELLGADGVSGILKELLIGFVYDKDSDEFKNAYNSYKNNMDAFVYDVLVPFFAKDYLPGLDLDAKSTIEDLLMDIYNISYEKYIGPALTGLDYDFATAEYEPLRALNQIVFLDGEKFEDATGLTYDKNSSLSFQDQVSNILGNYMKLIVPGYTWKTGGYASLRDNIEESIKYVANASGLVKNADGKTIEQIGVEIALMILQNGDFGNYEAGLEDCKTLEEMVTRLLINTAKEMKIGVDYTGKESYLVVIGDILGAFVYDYLPFTDYNGKAYRAGGGKDVFEVANYILNYILFDRAGASVLGLSTSKTEDFFTKLDKLADYFGAGKKVDFNSKNFIYGLLDCVFRLDIVGIVDRTVIPALNKAGNVSVVEFLYRTVQYFCNNWAGKTLFPEYQSNAFTNALSNDNIATMISVLLETVNNRKDGVVTLLTYVVALGTEGSKTTDTAIESASVSDVVATGKDLFPTATVTAGGKTLTQNVDFVVVTDYLEPGAATATIRGIGDYSGEIERSFNIKMDNVSSLSYTSSTSAITLKWNKVPYAESYNVYRYDEASKKYVTVKAGVTGTSYKVSGLTSGSEYKFRVKAVDSVVGATTAKSVTAYTLPSAVSSSGISSSSTASSVKLTWKAVPGATHYKIEKYAGSDKWTRLGLADSTCYTVSGLSGGTTYAIKITALKKIGDNKYLFASPVTVKVKTILSTPSSIKASYAEKSINLSWAKVKNASKYVIKQYTGSEWKTLATVTGTSYTVKNLSPAKEYKFAVYATGTDYKTSSAGKITAYTLPSAVKSTSVKTSSTPSTIKLTWSKVTGATHYRIEKYASKKWNTVATVEGTSYTAKSLSGFTTYAFRITALKKLSNGSYIASAPITVKAKTTLGTPSSFKASYTDTSITLTWSKVTKAEKYEVQRYVDGKWKTIKTVTGTSHKITGLKSATGYKLAVRAIATENGKNVYGSRKEITQYTGLVKPSSVKATSITATSAKITWSKVSKAQSYEVYAYIGSEWVKKGTTKNTSLTVKDLPSGTKTKIRVRAVASLGGKTIYGTYSGAITVLTTVAKVTGLKASNRDSDSITLAWSKTTGATSYEIYRLVSGKWKKIGTATGTSFKVKSLSKNTEYKFKVRAVQKISSTTTRYGEYSAQLTAKTRWSLF